MRGAHLRLSEWTQYGCRDSFDLIGDRMTGLYSDVASLEGFRLDLADLEENYTANATRIAGAISISGTHTGLMAGVASRLDSFRSAISSAQRTDAAAMTSLGVQLGNTAAEYRSSEYAAAQSISSGMLSVGAEPHDPGSATARFGGLQLPTLPDSQDEVLGVRRAVEAAISTLSLFEDRIFTAAQVKPVATYLEPLLADWEILKSIGKRIDLLGIDDFIASGNLQGGVAWLRSTWSGAASDAFAASADALRASLAQRSDDLAAVARILESGGSYLERLAYNQAAGLCGDILEPKTHLGLTLPVGVWAPYINSPLPEEIKRDITASVDALKSAADLRRTAADDAAEYISASLEYVCGRPIPTVGPGLFELPEKVSTGLGTRKYGYGSNIWWEEHLDQVL